MCLGGRTILHLYLFTCMGVCMSMCVCMCVCKCVWRPKVNLGCHSPVWFTLFLEAGSVTVLELAKCDRLASEPQASPASPVLRLLVYTHYAQAFRWVLGTKLCTILSYLSSPEYLSGPLNKALVILLSYSQVSRQSF